MMNKRGSSNTIPIHLIYEILSRLPAKSISRFCCVSKQWKSIVCSQYFKDLFHTMSSLNPRLLIFVQTLGHQSLRFLSCPGPESSSSLVVASAVDVRTMSSGHHSPYNCTYCDRKYTYVSGLIYLPGKSHAICNPSMGQSTIHHLPPAPKCCGILGYDPIGKQFKVLIYKAIYYDELVYYILTIGTENERWREIKCPLTYLRHYVYDHICINGILYYIADKKDEDFNGQLLGCFDVRSEKFKFLYPNFLDRKRFTSLINYKGKLCGIREKFNDEGGFPYKICMWVLEDVDNVVWKKYVYTLKGTENTFFDKSVFYNLFVVGATTSGDIVIKKEHLHKRKSIYIIYFNPERNTLRLVEFEDEKLSFHHHRSQYFVRYSVDHVENLGFDFMKTAYEPARTEASTSSSSDY